VCRPCVYLHGTIACRLRSPTTTLCAYSMQQRAGYNYHTHELIQVRQAVALTNAVQSCAQARAVREGSFCSIRQCYFLYQHCKVRYIMESCSMRRQAINVGEWYLTAVQLHCGLECYWELRVGSDARSKSERRRHLCFDED
jgi:hypothetical protein